MRRRCTCRMSVVLTLCLSLAVAASLLPLSAEPAVSQAIVFADTFSREDAAATPADSLGKTEPGPGQVVLDYKELGGCCGTPSVADVAQITAGSLVVRGPGTDPAWVELDDAGSDLDLRVDAEVLTPYFAPSTIANSVSFMFRNAGFGADGTVFTPGSISFELFPSGRFSIRSFRTGMNDTIEYPPDGNVDAASFAAADRNHDGLLDTGEPFSVRLVLRGTSFRFYFNDVLQLAIDSGLPVPPPEGDRLLFGRNRWQWSSNPVAIRFDNLRRKPPAIPVSIDIRPGGSSNCINNNGRGLIPVAIFGSPALDVTRIDPATLRLESLAPRTVGPQRRPLTQIENVNADGFPDLMVQMRNVAGAFRPGAQTARLTGSLYDGTPLEGTDTICIVP